MYASQNAPTKFVRYQRWLLCWRKFDVPGNADALSITISCEVDNLDSYDPDVGDYVVYTGNYTLSAALDSDSASSGHTSTTISVIGSYDWVPPFWR